MTRVCRVCGEKYTGEKWIPINDGTGRLMRTCCGKPNYTLQEIKKVNN
jgi:NMD protein affecting ribosome stability and mRNA decay